MSPSSMRRARAARVVGIALLLAGFAPVLVFAIGSLLPAAQTSAALPFFPELPWLAAFEQWLHSRRVRWSPPSGLVYALPGLALMFLGAALAHAQRPALEAERARKADARRRAHLYGGGQRIEPTFRPVDALD